MEENGKRERRISKWAIIAGLALALVCLAAGFILVSSMMMAGGAAPEEPVVEEEAAEEPETEDSPTAVEPIPTSPLPGTATAAAAPSSTPARTASPVGSPAPAGETLEVAQEGQVSEAEGLGEVDVTWPVRMSPGSSDIVRLSIEIPERLMSLEPMSVERVVLPAGSQPAIGELSSDQATILVGRVMRVKLTSPTFAVVAEYPAAQAVDVETIASPTLWAWTVVAPDRAGKHILTVKIYQGEETAQPSWVRAYQVEVLELSRTPAAPSSAAAVPTPSSEPSPTPALSERIKEGALENVVEILISVVSLLLSGVAWIVGVGYRARKKRTEKIASLRKELAGEAGEAGEELEALEKEIAQLEAVRWWQFGKWGE